MRKTPNKNNQSASGGEANNIGPGRGRDPGSGLHVRHQPDPTSDGGMR